MKVGVIGLGKMGSAIVHRLLESSHEVFAFDTDKSLMQQAINQGATGVQSIQEMTSHVSIFWLMVPAGKIVDSVLQELTTHAKKDSIIIDGGNSNFTDSIERANRLKNLGFHFIDCGTSGGIHGKQIGFSLMIGGNKEIITSIEPLFKAIAHVDGYGYVGPSGTGHYVKMVHNGIEYALLQAYAEGLHLLHDGHYKDLDLATITDIWQHGSIIRSWILELAHTILEKDQNFKDISGKIEESGTGKWTVQEAHKQNIPVKLIEDALEIRAWSRKTGGNYATKLVALLRNAFGGHSFGKTDKS